MGELINICIPSGNFGNMLGAFLAKRMGLPIDKLICASNENKILTDFLNTGIFDLRDRNLKLSYSAAIDILKPSNIERLLYYITNGNCVSIKKWFEDLNTKNYFEVDEDTKIKLKREFIADNCTEEDSLVYIDKMYKENNYIIDPHTAVAKCIADRHNDPNRITLIASTAHYAKFPEAIFKSLNIPCPKTLEEKILALQKLNAKNPFHSNLIDIYKKPIIHKNEINTDIEELKSFILKKLKEFNTKGYNSHF